MSAIDVQWYSHHHKSDFHIRMTIGNRLIDKVFIRQSYRRDTNMGDSNLYINTSISRTIIISMLEVVRRQTITLKNVEHMITILCTL